jgi:thiamine pyrophosphokinase
MKPTFDGVIVANGLFPTKAETLGLLRDAPFVIACDGAAQKLADANIPMHAIVGDLDSLPQVLRDQYAGAVHHSPDQMTNDLTKSVCFAREKGFKRLLILGATGLREDHTLGNISLLTEYIQDFESIEMRSDFGVFIPLKQTTTLPSTPGQQVSIFAISPQTAITTSGLRWEVSDRRFTCWWQGTLNEALGDRFTIHFEGEGRIVIYQAFVDYK